MAATSWYRLTRGKSLEQGDIIPDCPIFFPGKVGLEADAGESQVKLEGKVYDVIVLTQTCDLQLDQGDQKVQQVVLCPIATLAELRATPGHTIKNNQVLRDAAGMKQPAFFVLDSFENSKYPTLNRGVTVVHFRQVYTLPINVLREVAKKRGWRLRLKSPYKEALSSRFGMFFGRVALDRPINNAELKLPPPPAPAGAGHS